MTHPGGHYVEMCEDHGRILAQCRCPAKDKTAYLKPCPGPPACAPPRPGADVTLSEIIGDSTVIHFRGLVPTADLPAVLRLLIEKAKTP